MSAGADVLARFGKRVRKLRQDAGMSQDAFADLCQLDRTYIGGIERGERNIGLKNIDAIASAFKRSIADLMKGV
jgi:transcriptional regulator with XRE-family HTH domain